MTSIGVTRHKNVEGGGEGQGVWTSHFKYLWLSLPIPFLQWFHYLFPKLFLKFSRFPQPKDFSFPPSLFLPLSKGSHPPVLTNPGRWFGNNRPRLTIRSFDIQLSGWKSFNICHVWCIFFLCPKHATKKLIINFLRKRSGFLKHLTIKNFDKTFRRSILKMCWRRFEVWLKSLSSQRMKDNKMFKY